MDRDCGAGWNVVVGNDCSRIIEAVRSIRLGGERGNEFGDGCAALHIVETLQIQHRSSEL